MNISSLIQGFSSYLESLNEVSPKEYNTNSSSISIFMYSSEFKTYLSEELEISDSSIFSKSINDILSMDVVNGKLVEINDDNTDSFISSSEGNEDSAEQQITDGQENETIQMPEDIVLPQENIQSEDAASDTTNMNAEDIETTNESLTELLNNLFQDQTVISALDANESGDLDKDEIANFLNDINKFDGDSNNLSLNDILAGIEQIKEKVESEKAENIDEETPNVEETNEQESIPTNTTTPSSSSNNFSNGSIGNSGSTSSSVGTETIQEKSLDNMTREELNTELTTAEGELTEKQDILSSILNGSEENIQAMTEDMENMYDAYLSELKTVDEDMAKQVDSLKGNIDDQEKLIDTKDQEIANQENVVADSENAYNNAVANTQQLKASLSALQSTDTSNMDDSQIAELNSKIAELQAKITESEQAEAEAEQALNDAKDRLDTLNTERESYQTELDNLNQQMTELEAKIVEAYPQVQESLNAYKEAKQLRDSYKAEATSAIKTEISTAQNYVNEIKTAINNFDNKEVAKEYVLDGLTDLTRTAIELAYLQLGVYEDGGDNRGTMEKYGGGAGVPWCAAFVSWLYGKGQDGTASPLNFDASVSGLRAQAKEAGYYSEVGTYTPVPGDIMIQKSNGASHTGIVVGVDDKYIYTIEGNSGDAVRERKYEIGSGSYSKISGWIRLNEWSGGSSDIPRDTYLANNNSEDANEKERSTR